MNNLRMIREGTASSNSAYVREIESMHDDDGDYWFKRLLEPCLTKGSEEKEREEEEREEKGTEWKERKRKGF